MSSSVRRSKRKAVDSEPPVHEGTPGPRRPRRSAANAAGSSLAAARNSGDSSPQGLSTPTSSNHDLGTPATFSSKQESGDEEQQSPMSESVKRSVKSMVRWQAGASAALKSIASEKRSKNAEEGNTSPPGGVRRSSSSPKIWSIGSLTKGLMAVSPQLREQRRPVEHGKVDAGHLNGNQAYMGEKKGTIWNAVRYPQSPEGKASWARATEGGVERDWMVGKERGAMGETPLHLAVLYHEGEASDKLVQTMWDRYPRLRTTIYEEPLYRGENVLHIAIVRRLDRHILEMFVDSPQGPALLKQRAVGNFFKDPKLSDGCCNYGEFPLGFAACTNQKETFDYLVSRGASLSMTTYEGHNLLHLMVLHSKNKLRAAEEAEEGLEGEEDEYAKTSRWCKVMYDHIEEHLKRVDLLESAMTQRDENNQTPLSLAAAEGSLDMFNHLFNKLMKIEWVFGPVTCRNLCLLGIDVPLENELKEMHGALSVMDVVVNAERLDILSDGQLRKILDSKWDKYAKATFRKRFWLAIAFAFAQILITSTDTTHIDPENTARFSPIRIAVQVLLVVVELTCVLLYIRHSAREILRLRSLGIRNYLDTNRTHVFERLHALLSSPLCILLLIFRWWRCAFGSFVGRQTCHPMHMDVCGAPESSSIISKVVYSLVNLMDCRYQPHLLVSAMEKNIIMSLSLFQSCLSFMNIFRGMMGFQEYGHFVLMLMQMLQHDMRKFSVIYFIFLFGFSHMLYITSDQQNSGYLSFFDSMRIGFQAVLQQVDLNIEENQNLGPWSVKMIFIIVLANFFLVSLVLINLLIAMMSSTYDDINDASKRQWNLVRARIITNFDKEMTDKERCSEANIFWNWEDPTRKSGKRIMTFTTSENLVRYLAGECK